jgi:hypothetical protein
MSWLFLFVRAGLRIGISYSSIQTPAPTALLQWSESEVEKEAERNDKKTARECIRDSRVGLYGFHVRADIDFLICPSSLLLLLLLLSFLHFSFFFLFVFHLFLFLYTSFFLIFSAVPFGFFAFFCAAYF